MISIIAVIAKNRAIGLNGRLLWDIPEDLKKFRQLTTGHPVIMGRKTYESIGRTLPNRTNIIITHDNAYKAEHCIITSSLDEAVKVAEKQLGNDEIFIIGGGQIYEQAMPITDKLYITLVENEPAADSFFPAYPEFANVLKQEKGEHKGLAYTFYELMK